MGEGGWCLLVSHNLLPYVHFVFPSPCPEVPQPHFPEAQHGSIPPSRPSPSLEVGFISSGLPRSFLFRKREITRPVIPLTFQPLQEQFCPQPQHMGGTGGPVPTQAAHGRDAWHSHPYIETGHISHLLSPHTPKSPSRFSAVSSPLAPWQGHLSTAGPEHVPGVAAHGEEVQRQL